MKEFNGWYFKHTNQQNTVSFIVGVSNDHSFIQVIDSSTSRSYYLKYPKEEFHYNKNPFSLQIENNYFSKEKMKVDIKTEEVIIQGELKYTDITPIEHSLYSPNIMGPFGYVQMECNHEIVSLYHEISGTLIINQNTLVFDHDIGYIERDYGISFPSKYIWIQSNQINQIGKHCLFFSLANIPVKCFHFMGLICILYCNNHEYRFSTYYLAKTKVTKMKDGYLIQIHQGRLRLELNLHYQKGSALIAPKKGNMQDEIEESLNSRVEVKLFEKNKMIWEGTFQPTTVELVNF